MLDGERDDEPTRGAAVFAAAPVRQPRSVPLGALIAVAVGIVAFIGGMAVAAGGSGERASPGTLPISSPAAALPSPLPIPPSPRPRPAVAPGSSAFAASFLPAALIAGVPGAGDCVAGAPREKEVPRTRLVGPRMTFQRSWLVYCPIPVELRGALLLKVMEGLVRAVPAETYGYSTAGNGAADALFPYAEDTLAGTVAVTADAAGDGLAIAIVLEEWRIDGQAP